MDEFLLVVSADGQPNAYVVHQEQDYFHRLEILNVEDRHFPLHLAPQGGIVKHGQEHPNYIPDNKAQELIPLLVAEAQVLDKLQNCENGHQRVHQYLLAGLPALTGGWLY